MIREGVFLFCNESKTCESSQLKDLSTDME